MNVSSLIYEGRKPVSIEFFSSEGFLVKLNFGDKKIMYFLVKSLEDKTETLSPC